MNQIQNIGVDELSTHGGTSYTKEMTRRFCGMKSYPLTFPLKHPTTLLLDPAFENKIGDIILYPFRTRVKIRLSKIIRMMFRIPDKTSIAVYVKNLFRIKV